MTSTIRGNYPLNTFRTVRDLWHQMAREISNQRGYTTKQDVRLVTDAELLTTQNRVATEDTSTKVATLKNLPQFSLLQSERFQALLTGKIVNLANSQQVEIEITFIPANIDRFLLPLIPYLPSTVQLIADPDFTNDSHLQSHFTQLLLSTISEQQIYGSFAANIHPRIEHPSHRELDLQQQVAQAHLLNYIITQIHQTLDLPIILQAAVEQVQTFLHADRLIIYQFEFAKIGGNSSKSFDAYQGVGRVAYESIGIANLQSVLDVKEHQDCFDDRQLWHNYQDGMTKSIDRVDLEYARNQCMLDLMKRSQIESKLVVPIVVNSELWGLLIAHQCQSPREWQVRETQFLQKVAEHLALAINQSELYSASLWYTQNLEQRVNERTRELRDAVIVAQTANQSKTEFLALLSHELRTPLTSILGLSATLLRLPLTNLTERQQKYLHIIHNSGEHLSELIDDILDFYKLEVGKTFLKISEFSLAKLVEQVVEIVKAKAEYGKIALEIHTISNSNTSQINGRDLRFRGDTKRVRQILLNILTNAIKFTPEHGTVIVRTWLEDSTAVFEVEDSGIGIEAEQIPRLFKKFQQLNSEHDRDYGGMGLGLAITQQLVELHGGSIEVDSIVGSGSTFTVRLATQPLQLPTNDWVQMDRQLVFRDPELNPIPTRIVLIEQDEDLANFICDILTAARYQVTWLLSAESSFRQISMFEPDLLIVDLTQHADIVDRLIGNIRKSSKISQIKILAIATKEDTINPISQQYVDDYLWLQVNPEQLLRKITKLLSSIGVRE
ncbi:ATP-binding protein [Chamaesiphon sp.]|uniref:hybrid sensor histidine kinase/response regulator n=1 Tax=Chamaesiphon sp. TaxID=2814140 RepID=UPI0035939CFA